MSSETAYNFIQCFFALVCDCQLTIFTLLISYTPFLPHKIICLDLLFCFYRGSFSSVGGACDCVAEGRGSDSGGRTNTPGLKISEK